MNNDQNNAFLARMNAANGRFTQIHVHNFF